MNIFETDILNGLKGQPKRLSSKYFYDDAGSRLFQQIMALPEYYLTNCESTILTMHGPSIAGLFAGNETIDIVEFGSGDGSKTQILLKAFKKASISFQYIPVDISKGSLDTLKTYMAGKLPWLEIRPVVGDYLQSLDLLRSDGRRKLVLFMGSNIGNYTLDASAEFLRSISQRLETGDCLLIGFDLVKHPKTIREAYNDRQGVTKAFNLNLLKRINKEMGSDFDIGHFDHYESYDPEMMEARSYIISLRDQQVDFPRHGLHIPFKKWEFIHVEVSRKYTLEQVEALSGATGFKIDRNYFDSQHYFVDSVWKKV